MCSFENSTSGSESRLRTVWTEGKFNLPTCNPLHLHLPRLDASLCQPLLCNDAADVVGKDEVGLQDGQRLGMWVGAGLMNDDVQGPAVILNA